MEKQSRRLFEKTDEAYNLGIKFFKCSKKIVSNVQTNQRRKYEITEIVVVDVRRVIAVAGENRARADFC